jgi:sirohydrochlorin ferrochelatase
LQLHQFGCGGDEHVLRAVGCGIAVAQHSDAEVVQPVGVPVVDRRERKLVAAGRGNGDFGVVERVSGLERGDRHESPSGCPHRSRRSEVLK